MVSLEENWMSKGAWYSRRVMWVYFFALVMLIFGIGAFLAMITLPKSTACLDQQEVILMFEDGTSNAYFLKSKDMPWFIESSKLLFTPVGGQPNSWKPPRLVAIDVANAVCATKVPVKSRAIVYSFGPPRRVWHSSKQP